MHWYVWLAKWILGNLALHPPYLTLNHLVLGHLLAPCAQE